MQAQTQKSWVKDRANWFVINMLLVYLVWKLFLYYEKHSNGFVHSAWGKLNVFLGGIYASAASFVLNVMGEFTVHNGIAIYYPVKNKIISVADHCLAIPATVIFIGTILLFKGSWKNKAWFVPLGILLIAVINLVRLIFLCQTFGYFSQQVFDVIHRVIYVVITYAFIFLLIMWWMKKFADKK